MSGPTKDFWDCLGWGLFWFLFAIGVGSCNMMSARAAAPADADPRFAEWFQSLRMPDRPEMSCCGNGDAYYVDDLDTVDGRVFATITDNRGNPLPVGTRVEIPASKMNRDANPTGRYIAFISPMQTVWCFISGSGV